MNQDPIGLEGGDNIYLFSPNIQSWIDPLGLLSWNTARKQFWKAEAKKERNQHMVTGLEIKNLIQSHEYKRLLDKAEHEYGIKIYDNDESISQECNSVANEINKSGLTPELILDFIIENDKLVFNFSKLKISKLSEDYCDFEEDEEDSDDIILIGQAKTFLIVNSIEILLLRKSETDLINFLKAIKIPSYKKYAKELFEFYQESLKIY